MYCDGLIVVNSIAFTRCSIEVAPCPGWCYKMGGGTRYSTTSDLPYPPGAGAYYSARDVTYFDSKFAALKYYITLPNRLYADMCLEKHWSHDEI